MKKLLLVCALCMCVILAGCNDKANNVTLDTDTLDNEEIITNLDEENEEEIIGDEGINGFATDVNWKEVFTQKLSEVPEEETVSYVLYDLDKDNAPEMIMIRGEVEAEKLISICDCVANDSTAEVLVDDFGGNTRIAGVKEQGTVLFQYAFQGIEKVGRLNYANGAYEMEIVRELTPEQGLEYMPLEALEMFDKTDLTGLEWTENPADDNFQWINAGNSEA